MNKGSREYYSYILASKRNGSLYVGMTNDLVRRINEHREKKVEGFTKRYNITDLVLYNSHTSPEEAIKAEKRMKSCSRNEKIVMIERANPYWNDLYNEIIR